MHELPSTGECDVASVKTCNMRFIDHRISAALVVTTALIIPKGAREGFILEAKLSV